MPCALHLCLQVKVHHFKWRLGADRSFADRLRAFEDADVDSPCQTGGEDNGLSLEAAAALKNRRESERLASALASGARIDVESPALKCVEAVAPEVLPLSRSARSALAGVWQLAKRGAAADVQAAGDVRPAGDVA